MTVILANHAQPMTKWMALDIDDKWRIGQLVTEGNKRFIVQNGIKYQIKSNHTPQVYR
jgi:hypothetical protein